MHTDPALAQGSDEEIYRTFVQVALQLRQRLDLFISLPLDELDRLKLAAMIGEIGNKEKVSEVRS